MLFVRGSVVLIEYSAAILELIKPKLLEGTEFPEVLMLIGEEPKNLTDF